MKKSLLKYTRSYRGREYEKKAILYLQKNNYEIVSTNYRWKRYEVDIIAVDKQSDKKLLVFIEVKYRKNPSRYFSIESTINQKKQQNIIECSEQFLLAEPKKWGVYFCRYDVIFITTNTKIEQNQQDKKEMIKFNHIKNAYLKY